MRPFTEKNIGENVFLREFCGDVDQSELHWHRDRETRVVRAIGETDWMIQLDDELPRRLDRYVEIPVGVYHRLIKGNGRLVIKLVKIIS